MAKIVVNEQEYEVEDGLTILQAARHIGIEIPVFCYHERLSIAGNCRMCLVEVAGMPKPVASCALPITDGMVIKTQSDMAHKAQKGVLEFLLINHPLDCPICDQGGECDLQDITMAYGPSTTRFKENKRAVPDKYMGPLIKTAMNRCIHCTRCVRFAREVAGMPELGAIGRGEDMEITSYLDRLVGSELSANVIDLCPVGALTSAPYAFRGRPWELNKTPSIDVMDALGSHIRIDSYRMQVMRILPRTCEMINEEWLSDKARYVCDGLGQQRLDRPYIKDQGKWTPVRWEEAYNAIAESLKHHAPTAMAALAGPLVDVESTLALKDLLKNLGCSYFECRSEGVHIDSRHRGAYTFNTSLQNLEQADICLLIGVDLRREAPLLAARLRKAYLGGQLMVAYVGAPLGETDLTHKYTFLGNDIKLLDELISGSHPLAEGLRAAHYPLVMIGETAVKGEEGPMVLHKIFELVEAFNMVRPSWNGYNFVPQSAGLVGALDVGFAPASAYNSLEDIYQKVESGEITWLYLHGADDVDFSRLKKAFKIYQGHHGDRGAKHADIILPGAAYTEKSATYVNLEGRAQRALRAVDPPGMAKADDEIILELARYLKVKLPYQDATSLEAYLKEFYRAFKAMGSIYPHGLTEMGVKGNLTSRPLGGYGKTLYMTDVISRHSPTLAKCEQARQQEKLAHAF